MWPLIHISAGLNPDRGRKTANGVWLSISHFTGAEVGCAVPPSQAQHMDKAVWCEFTIYTTVCRIYRSSTPNIYLSHLQVSIPIDKWISTWITQNITWCCSVPFHTAGNSGWGWVGLKLAFSTLVKCSNWWRSEDCLSFGTCPCLIVHIYTNLTLLVSQSKRSWTFAIKKRKPRRQKK